MPRARRSHTVVLKDHAGSYKTGLVLLENEQGELLYTWDHAPALAPNVPPQDVSYGEFNPEQELVWDQNDWSLGGLRFYDDPHERRYYGISENAWPLTPNEISLGLQFQPVTFGVRNGACQMQATTNWSSSGITLSAETTAPHNGTHHFQGTSWSTNDYATINIHQTEQPAARLQGAAIVVHAKVRGSESGGTVRLQIVESGGSSEPTTNGSGVGLTTSYQDVTASVTVQADSTGIALRVQMSADGGSDRTVYFDSVQCHVGTAVPNLSNTRMLVMDTDLLCCTNRGVWKLDNTNGYWALQKLHGAAITGFAVFDDKAFIGQGESTAYQYSDADDPTSWTASNLSSSGNNANRFGKALNVNGDWALVKSLNDDDIHFSADPTNSGAWGSAIEAGKDDHDIIQLYEMGGALGVGKEDGFYQFRDIRGNRFINVYPGAEYAVSGDNFSRGIMYNGMFYTVMSEVGFMRYDGTAWEDLASVIESPGFDEFGNRIRAFGTDGQWLYAVVEDLESDSITKKCWLLALKEIGGRWIVHQVSSFVLSDCLDVAVFKTSGANNRHLFVNGDINDEAYSYRAVLPNRTSTPRLATNREMTTSATLITPYWDGGRPEVRKAFNEFTLISENLSGDRTVAVSYQLDNDTTFTDVNSTSSTFDGSPSGTLSFDSGVNGKRIRLKFTLTSSSTTSSPVIKGFALHMTWRPSRLRRWQMTADIDASSANLQGVGVNRASLLLGNLGFLQREVPPIQIEDLDGSTFEAHIVSFSEGQIKTRVDNGMPNYTRAINLVLRESKPGRFGWNFITWNDFKWG